MSYIIAATDLSPISENAVRYAAGLADSLRLELALIHAFSMPVMIGDVPAPATLINDTQEDAEHSMAGLRSKLTATYPSLTITTHILFGNLIECIEMYAASRKRPLLTVLGNSTGTESNTWFFSSLKSAANDLTFPVLAIPPDVTYQPPASICLALDVDRPQDATPLLKLNDLCVHLRTPLHVLNVQKDVFNRDNIPDVPAVVKAALSKASPHYQFRFEADVDETILNYCTDNGISWLAVVHGKYSLFEGIFHRSHTKALAGALHIPLLIIHGGAES